MKTKTYQELEQLADYITEREGEILSHWKKEVIKRGVESQNLLSISEDAFRNNIPVFLNHLIKSIRDREITSKVVGKKHGAQRWEYGLDLEATMQEWNVLQMVLMDQFNVFQDEHSLSRSALREAQRILADLINEGIVFSVNEYYQLEHKEAEAQLEDLKQALEEPEENIRSHNLRSTSHDLQGIMKNLQMGFYLLEDQELNEYVADLIDQMSIAADSLEQLLNDLLDLFRLETKREVVQLSEFDVSKVLNEVCESMQPMAKSSDLELKCSGSSPLMVKSDSKKIQRIARNLILNGLKYTREGHVEVSWREHSDNKWLLQISDTGPGLSATHAKSLTSEANEKESGYEEASLKEKAVSDEVQNHGEGIGLLIVRQLCKLLKANISIDTETNSGTTFKIFLPLVLSKG